MAVRKQQVVTVVNRARPPLTRGAGRCDTPKRVLDFDALWASDKLAACAEWAQAEYAWLYGLADASGSFEITNLRVIWGRVAAVRKNLSLERLEQIFDEFHARGLLFMWGDSGKKYGHWTGSDVPGRLPAPSWRCRLEKLAPPVPAGKLKAYVSQFSRSAVRAPIGSGQASSRGLSDVKPGPESTQAQDLDLDRDLKREWEKKERLAVEAVSQPAASRQIAPQVFALQSPTDQENNDEEKAPVEQKKEQEADQAEPDGRVLLDIYEQERGSLPAVRGLTTQRIALCNARIAGKRGAELATFIRDFRAAVQRARETPFLCGTNARRWRADFDWFIAKDENIRKVLAGAYDTYDAPAATGGQGSARSLGGFVMRDAVKNELVARELRAGAGPSAGGHVRAEVLERQRARELAKKAAP
jgi:hypothetical protein